MLLAVLEKRVGFKLAQKDVFLNIAGGLKVNDPAIDLLGLSVPSFRPIWTQPLSRKFAWREKSDCQERYVL